MRVKHPAFQPSVGDTTIPHALVRRGVATPIAPLPPAADLTGFEDSHVIGGEWLGVDQIDTEASQGQRVSGARAQDLDPVGRQLDDLGLARCAPEQAQAWAVQFDANPRAYARLWALGWLLTVLTLGLCYPWARARKLRYLYRHTRVAGHALDFHGQPRHMLRGFLLSAAVLLAYVFAGQWAPWVGALGLLIAVSAWPLLFQAAMQFRLAHTSWHGLPFGFSGRLSGAYQALAPILLMSGLALAATAWLAQHDDWRDPLDGVVSGLWLMSLLALPVGVWQIKTYQHGNLRFGPLRSQCKASLPMVAVPLIQAALLWGCGLLLIAALLVVAALSVGGSVISVLQNPQGNAVLLGCAAILLLIDILVARAWATVALQNLIWTKTGNRYVRFRSELPLGPYVALQLKNAMLILLTLGAYWPWAAIASRRLRLQAVTVVSRVVPDDLIASVQTQRGSRASEVDTQMLGLDLGW